MQVRSEKEIISIDSDAEGMEGFIAVGQISVEEEKFVFIIETKKISQLSPIVAACIAMAMRMS
ncbi:hypothetical protein BDZ91DRAFT_721189 [Kalaharituber pfeilii]|nr:hypothetical protein BDZ91DRAFT_721189 [Kalaharituber pfeilii]